MTLGGLLSLFFDPAKKHQWWHSGAVLPGTPWSGQSRSGVDKKAVGLEGWHWLVSVPSYVL
jgi:hypothetical protein